MMLAEELKGVMDKKTVKTIAVTLGILFAFNMVANAYINVRRIQEIKEQDRLKEKQIK